MFVYILEFYSNRQLHRQETTAYNNKMHSQILAGNNPQLNTFFKSAYDFCSNQLPKQ